MRVFCCCCFCVLPDLTVSQTLPSPLPTKMSTSPHKADAQLAVLEEQAAPPRFPQKLVWAIDLGGSSFTADLADVTTGQVLKTIKSKKLAESLHVVDDFIHPKKWTFTDYSAKPEHWRAAASVIAMLIAAATNGHEGIPDGLPLVIRQTGKIRALASIEDGTTVHDQWTSCFTKALVDAGITNVNYALLPNCVEAKFTVKAF